jgi:hypothetical protein
MHFAIGVRLDLQSRWSGAPQGDRRHKTFD